MSKGLRFLVLALCVVLGGGVCFAKAEYTIVPVPDTIVQEAPLDTAIYNNTAEFFTPYIVNEINKTQFMHAPTVSDVRSKIKSDYWLTKSTAKAMDDFRRYYKLDFGFAKKMSDLYGTNLVLFITSSTDANNYVMRRTWWDFFNVPGASVLDPAYKINIYAVLIDTDKDMIVWNNTYQKTLSVVENRIVPVGYTPQTEQLQKMKDYSVYLAPRFAQSLQNTLLTEAQKLVEPNMIHTDYGSIDNVFTKKYRGLRKEAKDATVIPAAKTREGYAVAKEKYNELKEDFQDYRAQKAAEKTNKEKSNWVLPINFNFFKKSQDVVPVQSAPEVVQTVNESVNTVVTPATNIVKEPVAQVKTVPVVSEPKQVAPVTEQVIKKTEEKPTLRSTIEAESIKPAVYTPVKSEKKKEAIIPADIDKRSELLLNKALKSSPASVWDDELPVDSIIYTSPSKFSVNEYLPVKPRIREIKTDDTYNAF